MKLVLVTGLCCSGKTSFSEKLSKHTGYPVVRTDNFKFGENWVHKPLKEFSDDLWSHLNTLSKTTEKIIVEGICWDTEGDFENQTTSVFKELIKYSDKLYIFKPLNKREHIASVINRSIGRYNNIVPQGTCNETSMNRAALIIGCVERYEKNCIALNNISKLANVEWIESIKPDMII